MSIRPIAFFALVVFTPVSALAETGPLGFGAAALNSEMEADRPDFTEATSTIDPGHLQIESGYTYTSNDDAGVTTESHTVPEALVRVGVLSNLETRLSWDGYVREHSHDEESAESESAEGVSDLAIGFKHLLVDQSSAIPDVAYLVDLGLASGSDDISSHHVEPELKLLWGYDLTDDASLSGNFNFAAPYSNERYFRFSVSASAGYSLTGDLGAYLEYFAFFPEGGSSDEEQHYANTGLSYSVCENMLGDVRIGFGLNGEADDFFTGAGLSWRI